MDCSRYASTSFSVADCTETAIPAHPRLIYLDSFVVGSASAGTAVGEVLDSMGVEMGFGRRYGFREPPWSVLHFYD